MPGSGNLLPLANLTVRFHHGDGCAKTSRLHQLLFGAVWLGVVGVMAIFRQPSVECRPTLLLSLTCHISLRKIRASDWADSLALSHR